MVTERLFTEDMTFEEMEEIFWAKFREAETVEDFDVLREAWNNDLPREVMNRKVDEYDEKRWAKNKK